MSTQKSTKVAYTKPTLIEYGSLAERTKIFGQPEGPSDFVIGPIVTSGAVSITTVTA